MIMGITLKYSETCMAFFYVNRFWFECRFSNVFNTETLPLTSVGVSGHYG